MITKAQIDVMTESERDKFWLEQNLMTISQLDDMLMQIYFEYKNTGKLSKITMLDIAATCKIDED